MVFRRSFSEPGAVHLHSFVLNQRKLWAGTPLFDRLSAFHAGCTALDCTPSKYRRVPRTEVHSRTSLDRHRAIWLLLLLIGIARMDGDVIGALFPIDSRAGATMWGRSAVATSATGFLIASAGYMFNAITAFLGVLVFFQRSAFWRCLAGAMFVVSLPYFLFEGARSHFLAAILPFIVTYLFYGPHPLLVKLAMLAVAFFCLDHGFKLVTAFRGTGFRDP